MLRIDPRIPFLPVLALLFSCGLTGAIREADDSLTLQAVSGNEQTAEIGRSLGEPLVVRVLDSNDNPVENEQVRFSVNTGTAFLNTEESIETDSDGQASIGVLLGDEVGDILILAELVPNLTEDEDRSVEFTIEATPATTARLYYVSGNSQIGPPEADLPEALTIVAKATDGTPLPDETVEFVVTGGDATTSGTTTTDTNGLASATVSLGEETGSGEVEARWDAPDGLEVFRFSFVSQEYVLRKVSGFKDENGDPYCVAVAELYPNDLVYEAVGRGNTPLTGEPVEVTVTNGYVIDGDGIIQTSLEKSTNSSGQVSFPVRAASSTASSSYAENLDILATLTNRAFGSTSSRLEFTKSVFVEGIPGGEDRIVRAEGTVYTIPPETFQVFGPCGEPRTNEVIAVWVQESGNCEPKIGGGFPGNHNEEWSTDGNGYLQEELKLSLFDSENRTIAYQIAILEKEFAFGVESTLCP